MDFATFFQENQKREKADKITRYHHLNRYVKKGQIVFAGSSLMEQFPIYEFLLDDQLPLTIYNRGIGGFTTSELLQALDACIFELEPPHLFLNIGTNDLNGPDYDQNRLLSNYEKILQAVRQHLPQTKLYLLAYYPVNPNVTDIPYLKEVFRHRTNERIAAASEGVQELAQKYGAQFLNLNEGLADADGNLKAEFTIEGMHMYADGYRVVLRNLLPVLKQISKSQRIL